MQQKRIVYTVPMLSLRCLAVGTILTGWFMAPALAATPGDYDYCAVVGLCGAGEGDCDGSQECQSGLLCVNDVGAKYGYDAVVDVCQPPERLAPGHYDYCVVEGPCGGGEGDCDSDSGCQSGLVCVNDVGAKYGFDAIVDVCQLPERLAPGHYDYCVVEGPCGAGEGDCDSNSGCQSGLVCVNDVGADYGFRSIVDVCEASPRDAVLGSNDYCVVAGPCGAGEGDCDSNSGCQTGLVCVNDVGANYGFRSIVDVCEVSSGWTLGGNDVPRPVHRLDRK